MQKRFLKFLVVPLLLCFMATAAHATFANREEELGNQRFEVTEDGLFPMDDSTYTLGADGSELLEVHCDTLVVGGDSVTGASQISTPMEDQGTYVRIAGDDDIKLFDNGNLTITGDAQVDMVTLENTAVIDNSSNSTVTIADNSDTLSIVFDATDIQFETSDGGIIFDLNQSDGTVDFMTNNDDDDYLQISTSGNEPLINAVGTADLNITASSGEIVFNDDNLTTTGTLDCGALTASSIGGVDTITGSTNSDVLSFAVDDVLSFSSDNGDGATVVHVIGYSGKDARIRLSADAAEDAGDEWFIDVDETDNLLGFWNETTELIDFDTSGNIDMVTGTTLTMGNDETIKNSTDDTVQVASNDTNTILEVYSPGTSNETASLILSADASTDAGDRWQVQADGSENLVMKNDTATVDVFVTKLTVAGADGDITTTGDIEIVDDMDLVIGTSADVKIQYDEAGDDQLIIQTFDVGAQATTDPLVVILVPASPTSDQDVFGVAKGDTQASVTSLFSVDEDGDIVVAGASSLVGNVTLTGDIAINGDDITTDGDLTITPTGVEVIIMGGLSVGDATQVADNNFAVAGTATVDGASTLTGTVTLTALGVTLDGSDGDLTITSIGGGYDEDLNINLDDTTNEATVTSSTGVALMEFGTINLATDALDLSDGNITNVGDVALDSLTADGTIVVVTPGDHLQMGTATLSAGNFTMIEGATASDPTFSIDQTTNDVIVSQTVGKLTVTAATDIYLDADGLDVIIGDSADEDSTIQITGDTSTVIIAYDEDNSDLEINQNLHLSGAAGVADNVVPDFQIVADADSDGTANTSETLQIKLTANATPTSAVWAFTNTQSAGYLFDDLIDTTGGITTTGGAFVGGTSSVQGTLALHDIGTISLYEDADSFSASVTCKDGAGEFLFNDDVNIGGAADAENLYIHNAGTLNVSEAGDSFTAVATCLDGAAEWQFNDDVNVGAAADAENLRVHNGGLVNLYEAGDTFNVQMECEDGEAVMDFTGGIDISGHIEGQGTANVIGLLTVGTLTSAAGNITMADAGTLTLNDDGGGNSVTVACNSAEDVATVTGGLDITGAVALNGDTLTCDADLTITPAGADVLLLGGLNIGDTTQAGDNNLIVNGTSQLMHASTVTDTTASRVISSGDYGKTIFFTYAGGVAVTLPANGATIGSWFRGINANSDTTAVTYTAATVDTLICFNDAQADSATYPTGHRIGSSTKFISNGSFWVMINETKEATLTVTT